MTTPARPGPDLRLVAAVLLAAIGTLVVRTLVGRSGMPFFADTDDAMRMVMVRDFLGGQPWYDLVAHRLNTPWGAEIHWSRLIDLPLALLVMGFTPLLGTDQAMVAAGYVWPMLLLGLLLWLSAALANRLVGPAGLLPAIILPVLSPAITAEFTPGRVDHHNVVILLTMAMLWTAIEAIHRPRWASLCGLAAATSFAIAIESVPAVAAAVLVIGLLWVADRRHARAMRWFGASFAVATAAHLALFRPPSRWLQAACDVISPFYLGIAIVVGVVFTGASLLALRRPWQRFAALALPGLAGLALVAWLYPQCLGGPYGELDPWLQHNWIGGILEARPWFVSVTELPAYAISVGLPVLLAIIVLVVRLWTVREQREDWAALLIFLLATSAIMLIQVRGARLAIMPAMPAAAWLIVWARQRYLAKPRLPQIAGLVFSWLAFSGVVLSLLVTAVVNAVPSQAQHVLETRSSKEACLVPAAFADLAALPPERILSPIDLGAHLLLYTPHEVVSAPYHRNQKGVRDTFRFFNDPISKAQTVLAKRGIGLVVLCPAMPEVLGRADKAPDSFAALYAADALPDWLVDQSIEGSPLRIYAVLPQQP